VLQNIVAKIAMGCVNRCLVPDPLRHRQALAFQQRAVEEGALVAVAVVTEDGDNGMAGAQLPRQLFGREKAIRITRHAHEDTQAEVGKGC